MSDLGRFLERRFYFAGLLPAVLALGLLTALPILYLLYLSLCQWDPGMALPRFIGLQNYVRMFTRDDMFWHGLRTSAIYVTSVVSIEFVLGFAIALLMNRDLFLQGVCRTLIILPMVITPVVGALTFRIMYSPTFGLTNYLLSLFGIPGKAWAADSQTALGALMVADIWHWTPFMFLMLLAGLQGLPKEPFEAARIDGASSIQCFRYLTLPMMKKIMVTAVVFRATDAFLAFDLIYMITQGGPGIVTQTLNIYTYYQGFQWFKLGYAASLAVVMLCILVGFVLGLGKVTRVPLMEVD